MPDLAFDARYLSTKNKDATFKDVHEANKILRKAQLQENVVLRYPKLGQIKDLKIVAFTDSSYRNSEDKEKSVGGRFIGLCNSDGDCAPLVWKSKTIQQVCKSVKSAETRSLEKGMEDGIYLARTIQEIYGSQKIIPVVVNTDSKTLYDSLTSTKKVEEKTIRHLVAWMKQQLEEDKSVEKVNWVSADEQIADVFTKKNVRSQQILNVVTSGHLKGSESFS